MVFLYAPTSLPRSHMLYCALTGQLLEKALAAVKKHMGGRRFVRAKERYLTDKQDLKPEPSLREFGIILVGGGRRHRSSRLEGLGVWRRDSCTLEPRSPK